MIAVLLPNWTDLVSFKDLVSLCFIERDMSIVELVGCDVLKHKCDPSREKGAYPNFTLWLFSRSWP